MLWEDDVEAGLQSVRPNKCFGLFELQIRELLPRAASLDRKDHDGDLDILVDQIGPLDDVFVNLHDWRAGPLVAVSLDFRRALPPIGQALAAITLVALEVGACCVDYQQVILGHSGVDQVVKVFLEVNLDFGDQSDLVHNVHVLGIWFRDLLFPARLVLDQRPDRVEDHVNRDVSWNLLLGDADCEFFNSSLVRESLLDFVENLLVDGRLSLDDDLLVERAQELICTAIDPLDFETEAYVGRGGRLWHIIFSSVPLGN